jgi:hypothetical protein
LKKIGLCVLMAAFACPTLLAQECVNLLQEMKLPDKVGTRGKPRMIKWQEVDKALNELSKQLQGKSCSFTFAQLFRTKHDDALFPLTNSVMRIVPEKSFEGMMVKTREGDELGEFGGRFRFDRSGGGYALNHYSLVSFQYRGDDGKFHTVGTDLLMDQYGVAWAKLRNKVAISTQ